MRSPLPGQPGRLDSRRGRGLRRHGVAGSRRRQRIRARLARALRCGIAAQAWPVHDGVVSSCHRTRRSCLGQTPEIRPVLPPAASASWPAAQSRRLPRTGGQYKTVGKSTATAVSPPSRRRANVMPPRRSADRPRGRMVFHQAVRGGHEHAVVTVRPPDQVRRRSTLPVNLDDHPLAVLIANMAAPEPARRRGRKVVTVDRTPQRRRVQAPHRLRMAARASPTIGGVRSSRSRKCRSGS